MKYFITCALCGVLFTPVLVSAIHLGSPHGVGSSVRPPAGSSQQLIRDSQMGRGLPPPSSQQLIRDAGMGRGLRPSWDPSRQLRVDAGMGRGLPPPSSQQLIRDAGMGRGLRPSSSPMPTPARTITPQRGMPPTQTGKPPGGRGGAWPVVVASLLWDMRPNQTLYDLNDTITRYEQKIHDMYWLDRHGQLTRAQDRELINMEIEVEKLRKERDRLRREAAAANPPRIRPPAGYDPLAPIIGLLPSDPLPLPIPRTDSPPEF